MVACGGNKRMAEVVPRSMSQEQSAYHENGNRSKLRPCGYVLQYCALLHAKNIDQRLQRNGGQGDQVAARDVEEAQGEHYLLRVQCGKGLVQIGRESHAQSCD